MKRNPSIAFILNFLLPGLGLLFLGKWKQAIVNLGIVLAAGYVVMLLVRQPVVWIATLGSISSGTWAYLVAQEMNMKATRAANQAPEDTTRTLADPQR